MSVQKRIIFHLQKLSFPIDSQLGVVPGGDLSCDVGLGVDFLLGRYCTDNHNYCDCKSAIVMLCPENSITQYNAPFSIT